MRRVVDDEHGELDVGARAVLVEERGGGILCVCIVLSIFVFFHVEHDALLLAARDDARGRGAPCKVAFASLKHEKCRVGIIGHVHWQARARFRKHGAKVQLPQFVQGQHGVGIHVHGHNLVREGLPVAVHDDVPLHVGTHENFERVAGHSEVEELELVRAASMWEDVVEVEHTFVVHDGIEGVAVHLHKDGWGIVGDECVLGRLHGHKAQATLFHVVAHAPVPAFRTLINGLEFFFGGRKERDAACEDVAHFGRGGRNFHLLELQQAPVLSLFNVGRGHLEVDDAVGGEDVDGRKCFRGVHEKLPTKVVAAQEVCHALSRLHDDGDGLCRLGCVRIVACACKFTNSLAAVFIRLPLLKGMKHRVVVCVGFVQAQACLLLVPFLLRRGVGYGAETGRPHLEHKEGKAVPVVVLGKLAEGVCRNGDVFE